MSWVIKKQFRLVKEPTKHYVLRHTNNGDYQINVPKTITSKVQAVKWLTNNPNKISKPNKFKAKIQPAFTTMWKKSPGGTFKLQSTTSNLTNNLFKKVNYTCSIRSKLFNGRIGYRPLNNAKLSPSKTLVPIGKGRQGIVFAASIHPNGADPFAIKISPHDLTAEKRKEIQPAQAEYNINKAAHEASPYGVIRPINLAFCIDFIAPSEITMSNVQNSTEYNKTKQAVMFMQLASEGSLSTWLNKLRSKKPSVLDDEIMVYIIGKICVTLKDIQTKYPEFRHNDLHTDNVFVDGVNGILMADFGWARLRKTGTNPAVNTIQASSSHAKTWGVGPETDIRYDQHLFLNDLRKWVMKNTKYASDGFKKTIKFLDVAVPVGYRGDTDTHVESMRLKYRDPCPGLPTLDQILKSAYLGYGKEGKIMYLMKFSKLKPGRIGTPKKPSPPPPKHASIKKMYTNAELMKIKPANYLKLSPAMKAKYKALKNKHVVKKPTVVIHDKKKNTVHTSVKTKKCITSQIIKNKKFNKLVEAKWKSQGSKANKNFQEAWNRARQNVIRNIENRLNKNMPAFSPSVAKAVSPLKKALPNSKIILNKFTINKNVSVLTVKNLKKPLIHAGYNETNARVEARKWANAWGTQLAVRRAALGWVRGNNNKLRIPGVKKGTLKLADSAFKVANLQKLAANHGISITLKGRKKTKEQLMNSLFNGKK